MFFGCLFHIFFGKQNVLIRRGSSLLVSSVALSSSLVSSVVLSSSLETSGEDRSHFSVFSLFMPSKWKFLIASAFIAQTEGSALIQGESI